MLCGDEGVERRRGVEDGKAFKEGLKLQEAPSLSNTPVFFEKESFPLLLSRNVIMVTTALRNQQPQTSVISNSKQMSGERKGGRI